MVTAIAVELPPDRPGPGEGLDAFCARHYAGHPGQLRFIMDPAYLRCAVAGIGGGKTEVGAFEAIRHCVRYPGSKGLVIAPTYRMLARSTRLVLLKVAKWWGGTLTVKEIKSEGRIEFSNVTGDDGEPSAIYFGHAQEANSLRALEVAWFWIDEAPLCSQEAFQVAMGRIRQPGVPHRGWLTGTPKGRNWVYETFVNGRDEWDEDRQATYGFHTWRTGANPLYKAEPQFLKALEREYGIGTDFYRQEIEASFVTFTGLVYREFDAAKHVSPSAPSSFVRVVAGVDWGYTAPGVIIVLGIAEDETVWLLDESYERQRPVDGLPGADWVSEAKDLQAKWKIQVFHADPEDPNAIAAFKRNGLNTEKANNARIPGIRAMQALITAGKFRVRGVPGEWCSAPNALAEFGQYHWRTDKDGNPVEDADPAKSFDHAMDALRYGVMALAGNAGHQVFF